MRRSHRSTPLRFWRGACVVAAAARALFVPVGRAASRPQRSGLAVASRTASAVRCALRGRKNQGLARGRGRPARKKARQKQVEGAVNARAAARVAATALVDLDTEVRTAAAAAHTAAALVLPGFLTSRDCA